MQINGISIACFAVAFLLITVVLPIVASMEEETKEFKQLKKGGF